MKPRVGLSISLGLSAALAISCAGNSSKKSQTPTAAPTPTGTAVVSTGSDGTSASAGGTNTSGSSSGSGSVTGNTGAGTGSTAGTGSGTNNGTGGSTGSTNAGGNNNGGVVTPVVSLLRGVWGVSLTQKPRTCSSIYDIRSEKSLAIYILCPNEAGKSVAVQTDAYTLLSDDGKNAVYQSAGSSCASQSPTLRFSYTVTSRDLNKYLVLNDGRHASPELQNIPEAALAGDLASATTLYGRAVVRGCFVGGELAKFEARKVVR